MNTTLMKVHLGHTHNGMFYFWEHDELGKVIGCFGSWDEHHCPYIDTLKPGQLMVDVGAHIGVFSVYAAMRGIRVVAFEASPDVFELLVKNVAVNKLERLVTCINKPLYDRETKLVQSTYQPYKVVDGKLDYTSQTNSAWLNLVPAESGEYETMSATLDSYHLENVGLLKTDTEGCDLRVMMGGIETIRRDHPIICHEYGHQGSIINQCTPEDYAKFFADLNYEVKVLTTWDAVATWRGNN